MFRYFFLCQASYVILFINSFNLWSKYMNESIQHIFIFSFYFVIQIEYTTFYSIYVSIFVEKKCISLLRLIFWKVYVFLIDIIYFLQYKRDLDHRELIRGPYNANKESKYVELVLVIDNREYKELGESRQRVIQHCKTIANIINGVSSNFHYLESDWSIATEISQIYMYSVKLYFGTRVAKNIQRISPRAKIKLKEVWIVFL